MRIISRYKDSSGVTRGQYIDDGGLFNYTGTPARDNFGWTVPDADTRPPVLYRKNGSEFHWYASQTADDGSVTVRIENIEPGSYWLVENPDLEDLKIWEVTVPPTGKITCRELLFGEFNDIPAAVARWLNLTDWLASAELSKLNLPD